jgi:hypothetical protein
MSNGQDVRVDITPIILAALPLARDLVTLIIDAVGAMQADDVTPEQIDAMMDVVRAKNEDIQTLVEEHRRSRAAPPG